VTRPIRREIKRRAAVKAVIRHVKTEHRMGRNYLKGRDGDRINAVLAVAGYNFSLLLRWRRSFCAPSSGPSFQSHHPSTSAKNGHSPVLHGLFDNFANHIDLPVRRTAAPI
jgi:hypothetical protein